jgi:hypothetical protein
MPAGGDLNGRDWLIILLVALLLVIVL